jgi:hypothetical protein
VADRRGFNSHLGDATLLGLFMLAGEFGKSFAKGRLDGDQRFVFFVGMVVAGGIVIAASAAFFVSNIMVDFGLAIILSGLKGFFDDIWQKPGP